MSKVQLEDRLQDLEDRIIALEVENEVMAERIEELGMLEDDIEAVTNELAYVDAYQENMECDMAYLETYVSEIEDVVDMVTDILFDED